MSRDEIRTERSCLSRVSAALLLVLSLGFHFPAVVQAQNAAAAAKNADATNEDVVVFIGDSLTDGYGVEKPQAYPNLVGEELRKRGHKVKVVNGGISGSVTADADKRVKFYLRLKPKILVLALGANDGLKGTPPEVIKKNLASAIDLAKKENIKVLLCGIRVFSNFGEDYTKNFEKVFSDLAKEKKIDFMPFLLEGVALDKELNIGDGKHPNAKGHAVIAKNVTQRLEKLL